MKHTMYLTKILLERMQVLVIVDGKAYTMNIIWAFLHNVFFVYKYGEHAKNLIYKIVGAFPWLKAYNVLHVKIRYLLDAMFTIYIYVSVQT